jgi:hypothetical protein
LIVSAVYRRYGALMAAFVLIWRLPLASFCSHDQTPCVFFQRFDKQTPRWIERLERASAISICDAVACSDLKNVANGLGKSS